MKKILLIFISSFFSLLSIAQGNSPQNNNTVSTYLHIQNQWNNKKGWNDPIISFILTNIDSLGSPNWESKEITDIEEEKDGYLVKVNVPLYLIGNSKEMWCTAKSIRSSSSGNDTIKKKYGGVKLSNIKLILRSNPEGAETYLIPNRIWDRNFENTSYNEKDSELQKFRVNTSSTNTYAFVDETVFVVVFKMNGKFKKIIHRTKPYEIEKEQTVWINF